MMDGLIYLASPYSHDDEKIMAERFDAVCKFAARLMRADMHVYSPIAHGHPLARFDLPKHFEYWKSHCEITLKKCDEVFVLAIDGWEDSVGVQYEMALAKSWGMPVMVCDPDWRFE